MSGGGSRDCKSRLKPAIVQAVAELDGGTMIKTAKKDPQVISEDWQLLKETIQGVHIKEVLHVPRDHGVITEVFRPEWDPTGLPVVQVYQSRLFPGAIGAWSCHTQTVDRLFVNQGHLKAVLHDGRENSATYGMINEVLLGDTRPALSSSPSASGTACKT